MSAVGDVMSHVFGTGRGWLATASWVRDEGGAAIRVQEQFFPWPNQGGRASRWATTETADGREVFFCPTLMATPTRKKEAARPPACLWADGDGAVVPPEFPEPTLVVESSPGRHHFYWRLARPIETEDHQRINQRLSYFLRADKNGWALNKLLRLPRGLNLKYPEQPRVRLLSIRHDLSYDPGEIEARLDPFIIGKDLAGASEFDEAPVQLDRDGLLWWRGEIVVDQSDGHAKSKREAAKVDRSATLHVLGAHLSRAGASRRTIADALAERDLALGFEKYTERPSGRAEYERIARKVFADSSYDRPSGSTRADLVNVSEVRAEKVSWLWPGRIPLGKLTILDGDPGLGKSTLMLDIAARVTRGDAMPDSTRSDLGGAASVVILSAEDGLADTIRPRLEAAGATLLRVIALRGVFE